MRRYRGTRATGADVGPDDAAMRTGSASKTARDWRGRSGTGPASRNTADAKTHEKSTYHASSQMPARCVRPRSRARSARTPDLHSIPVVGLVAGGGVAVSPTDV